MTCPQTALGRPRRARPCRQVSVVNGDGDVGRAHAHLKLYKCDANCFLEVQRKVTRADGRPFADAMARRPPPTPPPACAASAIAWTCGGAGG